MVTWLRAHRPGFSLRAATAKLPDLSPSLVCKLANGKRALTRDRVESVSLLLALNDREKSYLDSWVATSRRGQENVASTPEVKGATGSRRDGQNHLLADWLHVYVKDAVRLKGFKPEPRTICRLLGGMASEQKVAKSLKFLLHHGFLRINDQGETIEDHHLTTTTDSIPSKKIRAFHKKALEIGKQGIDLFPMEERYSSTIVLPLNESSVSELQEILKGFYDKLLAFAESHSDDQEQLFQVILNMTPVGGKIAKDTDTSQKTD